MSAQSVNMSRESEESKIKVSIRFGERDIELKKKINTPLQFFNHMIETIAWRACINIEVLAEVKDFKLTHVICEDVGLTMGETFNKMFSDRIEDGINGSGCSVSGIDEALSRVFIGFEDRSLLSFDEKSACGSEKVEDMLSADLVSFFEGFVQGAKTTLHIDVIKGSNPHHIWESIFRAFGESLRIVFNECLWRKGTTPGVKGNIELKEE